MTISKAGINFIKKWEGFRGNAYKALPNEPYYTIGYGHYGKDVSKDSVIAESEAEALLAQDLKKYVAYVESASKQGGYNFNQNQIDALVSFTYNCGKANLLKLTANGTRSVDMVGTKLLLYTKAGGKEITGLKNRRRAEHNLFFRGIYI